ncbi:MAG TPA: filamentous hemagglutinin, partial [Albitalea sp.]|nr:filamentous hemagglutinin [Albitalea sp.]
MKLPNRLSASRSPALRANRKFALHPLGVAALLMIGAPSWSLPTGGQVVSGQVTIQKPVGSTQLITQGTDKAAIDWTSFSIAAGEKVRFLQPSSSAVLLNRVTGY